jgi:hypothetical protein
MDDEDDYQVISDDDSSRSARLSLVAALGPALHSVGKILWTGGYIIGGDRVAGRSPFGYGNDAVVGLAIVAQTAGELCIGAALLLDHGNQYAAAALLRQLVEVEYLAWALAEDDEEAARWLRSTKGERLQQWQPRHIRKRSAGRFRSSDYAWHCDIGGHPTREGARLLPGHQPWPDFMGWLELAIHGASAWDYLQSGVKRFGYADVTESASTTILASALAAWRSSDRLRDQLREVTRSKNS